MKKEVSCLNTKAILEYVRRHNNGDLTLLLDHLDPELDSQKDLEQFLSDPNNWVSARIFSELCHRAREIFHDEKIVIKIGFESVGANRLGYIQRIFARSFGSPRMGLKKVHLINEKFNRTKSIEVVETSRRGGLVRLHWYKRIGLTRDFCYMNQGVYSALLTIWKIPPGQVVETQCFFEGAPFCEYRMRWQERSFFRGIFEKVFTPHRLLESAVKEMESDKHLLEKKYAEVYELNVELKQRISELSTLQDTSRAIVSILEEEKLFESVMKLLTSTTGFNRAILMLIDEKKRALRYAYSVGAGEDLLQPLLNYEVPLDRLSNVLARVASAGIPAFIEDAGRAPLNHDNLLLKLFKPKSFVVLPLTSRNRVIGVLGADKRRAGSGISGQERDYLMSFANQIAVAIDNARLYEGINASYLRSIQSLALALEAKDSYTKGHAEGVTRHAVEIAKHVGLASRECERLAQMSLMHDIGKIGIPESILLKPGKLSSSEWDLLCQHTIMGAKIIEPLHLPGNEIAVIKSHHERIDGKGYPEGLAGEEIPIEARIVSVADAFDAMTTDRPYRHALPLRTACRELTLNSGKQFDPEVVKVVLELVNQERMTSLQVIPFHQKRHLGI